MTTPAQAATLLYGQLKPGADQARSQYILSRTPSDLQAAMATLVGADDSLVSQGDSIVVTNAAGNPIAGSPGNAQVSGGNVTSIKLTV